MQARHIDRLFTFTFEKTAAEVIGKAKEKITALTAKNTERGARISKLREEYGIDDKAMIELYQQAREQEKTSNVYTYSSNAAVPGGGSKMEERTVGVGVINALFGEADFIKADEGNIKRLNFIVRNIRPLDRITDNGTKHKDDNFPLSYEELEFLGF